MQNSVSIIMRHTHWSRTWKIVPDNPYNERHDTGKPRERVIPRIKRTFNTHEIATYVKKFEKVVIAPTLFPSGMHAMCCVM